MDNIYIPLFSALGGALIGSFASIMTIWIQSHYQNKRERNRLAIEAAIEDHKAAVEVSKGHHQANLAPLTAFLHYHFKYLQLLETNKLTEESIKCLNAERDKLFGTVANN